MHVLADRPFGHGRDAEVGFRDTIPKRLETKINRFHLLSMSPLGKEGNGPRVLEPAPHRQNCI